MNQKPQATSKSKLMLETILEGGARVIRENGFEGATMGRIAEVAGVSVGSLYQHFASKDALIVELIRRYHENFRSIFHQNMEILQSLSLREAIPLIIRAITEVQYSDPELNRNIERYLDEAPPLQSYREMISHIMRFVRLLFESRKNEIQVKDLDLATYITVQAVTPLLRMALSFYPKREDKEKLSDGLARLVVSYLTAPEGS